MNVLYITKYFMSRISSVLVACPVYSRAAGVSGRRLSLGCLTPLLVKVQPKEREVPGENVKSKPLSIGPTPMHSLISHNAGWTTSE
jgi:hypothetical protein